MCSRVRVANYPATLQTATRVRTASIKGACLGLGWPCRFAPHSTCHLCSTQTQSLWPLASPPFQADWDVDQHQLSALALCRCSTTIPICWTAAAALPRCTTVGRLEPWRCKKTFEFTTSVVRLSRDQTHKTQCKPVFARFFVLICYVIHMLNNTYVIFEMFIKNWYCTIVR